MNSMKAALFALLLILLMVQPKFGADSAPSDLQTRLTRLEDFLVAQFNATVGLVRESPDDPFIRDYWLLSDNLIAMHILNATHSAIAAQINTTLHKYDILSDGLHEALFGGIIQLPPYTPIVRIVHNSSYIVKVEERGNATGKLQNDWAEYADLLVYVALSEHNEGNDDLGISYLNRVEAMWNEAGLFDKPTQQDGFYVTHKLALLMYAADVLNQTLPFQDLLEARIWQFQRPDGGIRSHYLGNLTSNREANSETAGLVLLAYEYHASKIAQQEVAQEALNRQAAERQQAILTAFAIIIVVAIATVVLVRRTKKNTQIK